MNLFYRGDVAAYGGDDSAADLALCGLLAFWCGPDPKRIDRLFRRSALMRGKWDSPRADTTYGALTIQKALGARRG
jgi:primase-polymerase (primpol)-like protein